VLHELQKHDWDILQKVLTWQIWIESWNAVKKSSISVVLRHFALISSINKIE
jgi:hypothetical protein